MTYEQRPGGHPASPDIDMGLPEVCDRCDRDCSEPCEAFKRLEAVKKYCSEVLEETKDFPNWMVIVRKLMRAILKILEAEE